MDNTYNIDFIARCIAGHNKTDIKSIIVELEKVQKQVGSVSLVEITQEDYNALTDKDPSTIYLVSNGDKITLYIGGSEVNEIEGIKVNNTTINPDANNVVNITVPTTAADVSALPDTTKYATALSLTINSSTFVMTGQLKDQNGDNLGTAQTIDLPLESVVVNGSYNNTTKKVVLTLQNGNTIEFSVADLVSGLQTELSTSNKLNPAFIEYDSTHRAVSDTEKSAWNSKQNALTTAQLAAVNSGIDSIKVEQIETNKNNISLLTPTVNDSGDAFTVGTDYTLCDACTLTIPAPANGQSIRVANILASLTFNNSAPRGIILSISNSATNYDNNLNLLAKIESTEYLRLSTQCMFFNYSNKSSNIYVWVKSSKSAINRVTSSMQLMN